MTEFYVSLEIARKLRKAGFKQVSIHYWHMKTKEVYHSNDVFRGRDFDKHYTSAYVDAELDQYLPDGVTLEKKNEVWCAKYKTYTSLPHVLSVNAKAALILILERKEFIHL